MDTYIHTCRFNNPSPGGTLSVYMAPKNSAPLDLVISETWSIKCLTPDACNVDARMYACALHGTCHMFTYCSAEIFPAESMFAYAPQDTCMYVLTTGAHT